MQQKYYIYAHIRPDKNEVFYIGLSKNLIRPFELHYGKRNEIWYKILKKNNKQIIVKILHEFDTLQEACEKEKELISHHGRIFNNTGTLSNLSMGGELIKKENRKFIQYDLDGNFIKIWESLNEILKEFKITNKAIYNAIEKSTPAKKFIWKFFKSDFSLKIESYREIKLKKIYQFDKNLNFINMYYKISEASLITKINQSSISSCLSNKRPSAGGFIWSYKENLNKPYKILEKYNLEGVLVNSYFNYVEAIKELNIISITSIKSCAEGKQKTAYGFVWKWKTFELQTSL